MRRSAAVIATASLIVIGVGVAAGGTTAMLEPTSAATGERVAVINGCYQVVDVAPATVPVAFLVDPALDPAGDGIPKTTAKLVASWTYRFTVPAIPPGVYTVRLECEPGDWRTNLAEGAGNIEPTVLPATSTAAMPTEPAPTSGSIVPWLFLGMGSAVLAAAALVHRTAHDPRRRR